MRKRLLILGCAFVLALALGGQAGAVNVKLNYYKATVSQDVSRGHLLAKGTDIASAKNVAMRRRVGARAHAVGGERAQATEVQRVPASQLRRARRRARRPPPSSRAASTSGGTTTGPTGSVHTSTTSRVRNPPLTKLEVIGHTGQGREIIALKMTQGAREVPDGSRPQCSIRRRNTPASGSRPRSTVSCSPTSSRSGGRTTSQSRTLLKENEFWFVLVLRTRTGTSTFSSPDTRLWRKNLRDNNGNGTTEVGDGVDRTGTTRSTGTTTTTSSSSRIQRYVSWPG